MFLKNISINNFKSIQKATVGFERGLNIVIGKNGAGKSNLLEFIRQNVSYYEVRGLSKPVNGTNAEYQFTIDYEQDNSTEELTIYLKRDRNFSEREMEYSNKIILSRISNGETKFNETAIINYGDNPIGRSEGLNTILREMDVLRRFNITFVFFKIPENNWLEKPERYEINRELFPFSDSTHAMSIFSYFSNCIVNEFDLQGLLQFDDIELETIRGLFSKAFVDFNEKYKINYTLSKFSPIQEIRINHNVNIYKVDNKILVQNLLFDFKINDTWMPWGYLSDGSKRLFYLITQCLSLKDGLLLIEEPELGIHPHQLFSLMQFLKEQSAEKQIIISTHSPIVLDVLKPGELDRITIAKIEHNGSQFYKLTDEQKALAKKYMTDVAELSYYWLHSDLETHD